MIGVARDVASTDSPAILSDVRFCDGGVAGFGCSLLLHAQLIPHPQRLLAVLCFAEQQEEDCRVVFVSQQLRCRCRRQQPPFPVEVLASTFSQPAPLADSLVQPHVAAGKLCIGSKAAVNQMRPRRLI
ncbi:MAG: hypothetical protein IH991_10610 [Planctomycetes bacterium]|nr:hypothetical protein [Planctomycetota bacterium]